MHELVAWIWPGYTAVVHAQSDIFYGTAECLHEHQNRYSMAFQGAENDLLSEHHKHRTPARPNFLVRALILKQYRFVYMQNLGVPCRLMDGMGTDFLAVPCRKRCRVNRVLVVIACFVILRVQLAIVLY